MVENGDGSEKGAVMEQIQIPQVLDVEAVERELAVLWKDSVGKQGDEDGALMRARVANLVIFTSAGSTLDEINEAVHQLSAVHPCRALVMVAERDAADRDIELYVSSFSHTDAGRQRLSCEELVLMAQGKFVRELPSAALPLVVSDLPVFLWWCDELRDDDRTFYDFRKAADRLIIDTAESAEPVETLLAVSRMYGDDEFDSLGISDLNWARLTSWRSLLASFYDPPQCKSVLSKIATVVIEYSAPEGAGSAIAPQALLFAGWLASRLGWQLSSQSATKSDATVSFELTADGRRFTLLLKRVDRPAMRPGRLARAELTTEGNRAAFVVSRHESGSPIETEVTIDGVSHPGRVLPVRNRSKAQLLGRELEIITNDDIYMETVRMAEQMIRLIT